MDFDLKIKRQEVSSWASLLIPDSSHELYYHIGTSYLDSSLQSELLFKEKKIVMFMEQILEIFWKSKFLYLILMVWIIFTMKYFV